MRRKKMSAQTSAIEVLSGLLVLTMSFVVHDPSETWAAPDFRSAKAFVFSLLKRDIVPLLRGHDPAREGRMAIHIGRRELIVTLGGAVAAWPLAAGAQQPERPRRVGVLMAQAADDLDGQ